MKIFVDENIPQKDYEGNKSVQRRRMARLNGNYAGYLLQYSKNKRESSMKRVVTHAMGSIFRVKIRDWS